MSSLEGPRPSFTHVSTHQTYVGKAVFEHARNCATIAAVACMSSSLLKSSLGPNLLALIEVEDKTFDLFDKIFLEYNPHMQLTQKLVVESDVGPIKSIRFIKKLKSNGPLFSSSLQEAEINSEFLSLFEGFRSLRSLTLFNVEQCKHLSVLKSLPSLSELKLIDFPELDAAFFKALGDLENNRNFTSLDISCHTIRTFELEGFQNDFCGRLLSKNQLVKLDLPPKIWECTNQAANEAVANAGMTNLVELISIPAKLIRAEACRNMRILSVADASDEDLVNIANHCPQLEVLLAEGKKLTGSFLKNKKLVEDAFKNIRELTLLGPKFSSAKTGFSRFFALERISIVALEGFDCNLLRHLPNPGRLRFFSVTGGDFLIRNLCRFVNLEEIDLSYAQLSREDILSFAQFKQLARITLDGCGGDCASSEPFRILASKLKENLEELTISDRDDDGSLSRWTQEDVEAILTECRWLRKLSFEFKDSKRNNVVNWARVCQIRIKFPRIKINLIISWASNTAG